MSEPLAVSGRDLSGKRVLVVGLGRSGVAASLFLREHGARVTISDSKPQEHLRGEIPHLLDKGIEVESGGHGERTFQQQDLVVLSPGVPLSLPQLAPARHEGIPIIGEVELASRFLQGHTIAITGSNGKTTTTSLTAEILAAHGRDVLLGGNIGTPVISLVGKSSPGGWNVLEISSFQLETIQHFHPEVAVVLNVTPDHLDRHGTMEAYIAAKQRIFENQGSGDRAVLNADDANCLRMGEGLQTQVFWFSRKKEVQQGAFVRSGNIVFFRRDVGETPVLPSADIPLKGAHNLENVLAAVSITMIAGCEPDRIAAAVRGFRAVEHRLEYVATIQGVEYYNDSKATNVDATIKALESFHNVHIILGGKDKGSDYSLLNPLLRERAKRVYTIGAAAAKIESQIAGATEIVSAGTLDMAVKKAVTCAVPGDVVLLAPACASFDQFENYEQRGRVFKELVDSLAAKTGNAA
jgi:UDP-N-acetylmuramoylalanine--D-glutamate ligase